MKCIFLLAAVVVLATSLPSRASVAPSSALCQKPSTACQRLLPFAGMVASAAQQVQAIRTSLRILQQRKTLVIQRSGQDGQCTEDIYNTNTPQDGLTCEHYLRELSKDLTFLNRFNLHYSSEVCQPTLAKSTDVLTCYFTTKVVQDLDTAVCTLRSMLTSSRAKSIGIAVDTSTGQPSCYNLSINQFQSALLNQTNCTLMRLTQMSAVC